MQTNKPDQSMELTVKKYSVQNGNKQDYSDGYSENSCKSDPVSPVQMRPDHDEILRCLNGKVQISHFDNVGSKNAITINFDEFISAIRTGIIRDKSWVSVFENIRQCKQADQKNKLKKSLPAVTISAICEGGHRKTNILKYSGFLQIDIDGLENAAQIKDVLKTDPYIYLLFISPSGNGLKCIINIGSSHPSDVFEYIRKYFQNEYALKIDTQVKDESRLCFYSYDPAVFVNEPCTVFECKTDQTQQSEVVCQVEMLVARVESAQIDITASYKDWLMLAFALSDAFGQAGEPYFHRLSRFYPKYNAHECSKQYTACLSAGSKTISIKHLISFINSTLENTGSLQASENPNPDTDAISFYIPCYDKDRNLKDLKIDYTKWIERLYDMGFRRFDIDKNYVFVRVSNQIIEEVTVTHIQDAFIHFLENLPEELGQGVTREFLIGKFYRNPSHYFCENRLNLLRPKEPFVFSQDTKDSCQIYFSNGFVCCTSAGYGLSPYSQMRGLIWKNQIVGRDFTYLDFSSLEPLTRGEFSIFVFNVSGKDHTRYESLITIIGYLLHSHFTGKLKAVVFTDSKISDVPSGRTGKTLLGQALGYIKKFTEINGKDFDTTNKHKYQEVNLDTQIVHLNDVRKNFDFETMFNDITEGIVVDKKNIKPFKVKAKMIISTNKTITIEGASAKDRAIEFEFSDHYSEKFSPEDEFGHWLFRDWDSGEWMRFFNFCLYCISSYLKTGILQAKPVNLNRRKLLEGTNQEFVEFMDSQVKDGGIIAGQEYDKKDLFDRFLLESPEYAEIKNFKQRRFTECLRAYAKYSGHFSAFDLDQHERKSGAVRYITFPSL